ncbi:aspartate kinase [Roseimarinus sediminis]|uniref:aspartate kinase n=1 Tax=Roseimarinus sediminis TaxID=1610899 RepID=UPI003D1AF651
MRVFKFGGASVKDAKGVKNLASIVAQSEGRLVVVVSAMGKMTNALEELVRAYYKKEEQKWEHLATIRNYHMQIVEELFGKEDEIFSQIDALLFKIEDRLDRTPSIDYDFEYDQLIGYGELLSTLIISAYLNKQGIQNTWKDIRFLLKTNNKWRDAAVEWELTGQLMNEAFHFKNENIYVTQGFLGATVADLTTTLGREGSDYTAAIIASVLGAEKVEIWKDVPGILNADPQYFKNPKKIDYMSYREAVELTFFGAKVIHPKTIKPLENNQIPMHVRSFIKPAAEGTIIGPDREEDQKKKKLPVYIMKTKQVLITVSQPDFSFMDEESMSWVIGIFSDLDMKINLLQHSALKLSVSIDQPEHGVMELIERLAEQFEVRYNDGLELITIRHYTAEAIEQEIAHRTVYVEQKTRRIARFLVVNSKKG